MSGQDILVIKEYVYNTLSTIKAILRGISDSTLQVNERHVMLRNGFIISVIEEIQLRVVLQGDGEITRDIVILSYSKEESEVLCHICDSKITDVEILEQVGMEVRALCEKLKARALYTGVSATPQ